MKAIDVVIMCLRTVTRVASEYILPHLDIAMICLMAIGLVVWVG